MNNFEESLNSLKEELFNLEEVKAYFKLKNEIENNEELISLTKEISGIVKIFLLSPIKSTTIAGSLLQFSTTNFSII